MPLRAAKLSVIVIVVSFLVPLVAGHGGGTTPRPPPAYTEAPPTEDIDISSAEPFCPKNRTWSEWRPAQTVLGVEMQADWSCKPDNPKVVAAVTKGTNNVPTKILMQTGLSEDAVEKGRDLDSDGDPDMINITLEVSEINGKKPAGQSFNSVRQEIAPGISPGFWVFSPKTRGMASEGSAGANLIRMPSPTIRVEQGDHVRVELENTHYMPHTIHFHGVDHAYTDSKGYGNDGVPQTSEEPVMPGESRTYNLQPRQPGTMAYHCHVQPQVHVLMGLNGMFVVSRNTANNTLQTLNIGGGKVRNPSKPVASNYSQEYDYIYQGVDKALHEIITMSNDPRVVSKMINRGYDVTERTADYFLLNGKSFPYTMRESQIIVGPDQRIKLRVINTGTTNNGLDSYGSGVWLVHNHKEDAITTNGIAPGGDLSTITYKSYLQANGRPEVQGTSWKVYFTEAYYERKVPVWNSYDPTGLFGEVGLRPASPVILLLFALVGLVVGSLVAVWVMRG
ncbi:MAG: multicopper oxidase domain-containing protein [Candidatus Nanohaloarchaea archaeon]|nr:multicopper oxidase domain-containing protein [Candidatus Nanohaloarchaea archaeon]